MSTALALLASWLAGLPATHGRRTSMYHQLHSTRCIVALLWTSTLVWSTVVVELVVLT